VFGRQVGADHIDAVKRGLGGDADGVLGKAERHVGDADLEMLGHVTPSQHGADRLADRRGAVQRTARPLHARCNARELLLGGRQQLGAFAGPLFGQQRVLAHHQALAGIVGAGDLGHVAIIEQRGLQRPAVSCELLDRWRPQCRDPIQTGRPQRLLDPRAGQHPAVAHHHYALQVEALLQLVDLRRQGQRIGGVAFKHLDCNRATLGRAHQANDQLRPVATVIAAVTVLRQFTAAPFEIGGGHVVEQQCALLEVAAGQLGFDEPLLAAQPVEHGIDLLGGHGAQPQHLAQRMAGGGRIQHPRGRQLGRRFEQTGNDQGQRQIAAALRRAAGQHRVERNAARRAERGEHVAVRQRADDFHRLRGGQQFATPQHGAELFNALGGPAGQVGEGSILGLAGLAVTLTQQDGRWRASVRDDSHIHAPL
jgi:hypothetical protein